MNVRTILTDALDMLGIGSTGLEPQSGAKFKRDVRIFKGLLSQARKLTPFLTKTTYNNISELSSTKYSSIKAAWALVGTARSPMKYLPPADFERNALVEGIQGDPAYYTLYANGDVKVYPDPAGYKIIVLGVYDLSQGLTASTSLDGNPEYFFNYLRLATAKTLAPFYQKQFQSENLLNDALNELLKNRDGVSEVFGKASNGSWWVNRPRNFIHV